MTTRERDPAIDALRAVAIVGVVVGHWLVTAIVLRPDGSLGTASPLAAMPWFAPVTWVLQTLGLFFFVAGYAAGRSRSHGAIDLVAQTGRATGLATRSHGAIDLLSPTKRYHRRGRSIGARAQGRWLAPRLIRLPRPDGWLGRRLGRLLRPVVGFAAAYAVLLVVAAVAGAPVATLRTVAKLAASPLWFLAVLAVLGLLTRPLLRVVARPGGPVAVVGAGVLLVAAADAAVAADPRAAAIAGRATPVLLVAAWLVPYALGLALARGRLPAGRRARALAWALLAGGAGAVVVLVVLGDYPASAVGVPGAGRSNLNPPSLATVALALAQAGAAMLIQGRRDQGRRDQGRRDQERRNQQRRNQQRRARRVGRRAVGWVNRQAMGVYLWHQTALIAVTVLALRLAGEPVPGLHTAPTGASWVVTRVLWLAAFAGTLWLILRLAGVPGNAGRHAARDLRPGAGVEQPGCTLSDVSPPAPAALPCPDDRVEVIAVRDSDPPSRGRASRQPR